jgi:hypothetical protein
MMYSCENVFFLIHHIYRSIENGVQKSQAYCGYTFCIIVKVSDYSYKDAHLSHLDQVLHVCD